MNTKITLGFVFVVAAIGLAAAGYSSSTFWCFKFNTIHAFAS